MNDLLKNCSVEIQVNQHRLDYEDVDKWLGDNYEYHDFTCDVLQGIRETGNIINISIYTDTPIGHYDIIDYNLERAVSRAIELTNEAHKETL